MAKRRVRFVVEFAGALRRILSVYEGSSGDLLLTTHLHGLLDLTEAGAAAVSESRDAIHVSEASESTTVHGVTVHEGGNTDHRYLLSNALRDHRFQPLHVRLMIHPRSLPILATPAKGELVSFPRYDPEKCTMLYAVWFCAPEDSGVFPRYAPYSYKILEFREFALIMSYCFTPKPSTAAGNIRYSTTTSAEKRSEAHAALNNRVGPAEGAPPLAVPGYIVRDFNQMIAMPVGAQGLAPDQPPLIPQHVEGFYSWPIL